MAISRSVAAAELREIALTLDGCPGFVLTAANLRDLAAELEDAGEAVEPGVPDQTTDCRAIH